MGRRRDRYLGLQAMVTALAATAFFAIGGAIGTSGWRAPFWLYVVSIVVALAMIPAIWPTRQTADGAERAVEKLPPLNWRALAVPSLVTIFGGIVFYTLIVELPYVLAAHQVTAPAAIGGVTAIASLATAIGAFLFRWLARFEARLLLPGSLGLAGIGMLVVAVAPAVPVVVVGAVIASFGTGLLLPTMITWCISRLTYDQRGRGTGVFTASIFFGEFLCPLVVLAATGAVGGLAPAIAAVGIAALVVGAALLLTMRARAAAPAHA
jgi:MFS family permease